MSLGDANSRIRAVPASAMIERAKPLSKEDALSDRLKNLRNQISTETPPVVPEASRSQDDVGPPSALNAHLGQAPPQEKAKDDLRHTGGPAGSDVGIPPVSSPTAPTIGREDMDPILDTDDQTLEELLADLGEDQQWLDEVAAEEEEEHRRVMALLEDLGKVPSSEAEEENTTSGCTKRGDTSGSVTDYDDSEGDEMTREADEVLTRALDEVNLEKSRRPSADSTREAINPPEDHPGPQDASTTSPSRTASLQGPPSSGDSFALPVAPSQLQDQPDELSETDADFETSIASRMAALRVSAEPALPSAPATDVNALGLPGAPTFTPHNRPVPRPLLGTRRGFTDDDQKTWCVVCLEDGTVRCRSCDGDFYCARCWKEMHVGPRAGYEERGHRWEKFVRE